MKRSLCLLAGLLVLWSCSGEKKDANVGETEVSGPPKLSHFDSSSTVVAQPAPIMPDDLRDQKIKERLIYRTPRKPNGKMETLLWFREVYDPEGRLTLVEHYETKDRLFLKKELYYNEEGKVSLINNFWRDDTNRVEYRYQDGLLMDKTVIAKDDSRILYQYTYQDTFTLTETVTAPGGALFERNSYQYSLGGARLAQEHLDGQVGTLRKTEYIYDDAGYKIEELVSEWADTAFVNLQSTKYNYDEQNRLQRDRQTHFFTQERTYNYYRYNDQGLMDRKRTNVVVGDNQLTTIEEYQYQSDGLLRQITINRDTKGQRIQYKYFK